MEKFLNKKIDYFWEYQYSFGEYFLKQIFKDSYKRKFSKDGDGMLNLIMLDNKVYNIDLKETNNYLLNDNKKAFRDSTKDIIIEKIKKVFDEKNIKYTVNSGKFITFQLGNTIAKIEVVKKTLSI